MYSLKNTLALTLCCIIAVQNLPAQRLPLIPPAERLSITEHCVCLSSSADTISVNVLRQHPGLLLECPPEEELDPAEGPVWLKCHLPKSHIPVRRSFLTVGIYDKITLFTSAKDGSLLVKQTGRMAPPDERAYPGFPYAFPVDSSELASGPVFLRIEDLLPLGRPHINLRLYDESSFLRLSNTIEAGLRRQHFIFGLLGGTFLAFFLFPLAYFLFNRQWYFLYYAIYVLLSFLFVCFTFERFGHMDLVFSYAPGLMEHIETPLNSFSIIFYFLFLRSFLDAKEKAPLLHWLLGFLVIYQLSFQVLDLFVFKLLFNNYKVAYEYAGLGTIPALLICLYLLFVVFRWKRADAAFIGFGMVFFLTGVVLSILEFEGAIVTTPYSLFDNHHIFFQLGIVLELFFFSFALSHRNRSTVHARIEAQSRLRHLEELDRAKNRLYTNITHEFRTPLQVILGLAEQIRKNPGLQLEKRLGLIRKNGQNLLSMANQMLDLSKLEAGYLSLRPVQSDVISYLKYLAESCHSAAAVKSISLTFSSDVSQLVMDYDPERLKQVVYNLLSNAIRFTPEGGVIQLAVSSRRPAPGDFLLLTVEDNGIGMDEAAQARIFDRFYSAAPLGEEHRGTGIGLTLVKELVALMGGRISLNSEMGKGTAFLVELPVSRTATPPEATAETEAPKEEGLPFAIEKTFFPSGQDAISLSPKAAKEIILIVEDSEDVRYYLRSLLAGHFQIVEAANGQSGIAKAIQLVPDIILSDIMMPKVDGFQLCRTLKTDPRTCHIPIVLLTAKATKQDKITGLQHGADGYLYKPIHEQELFLRLQNLAGLRRKLQEKYRQMHQMDAFQFDASDNDGAFLKRLHQIVLHNLGDEQFGPEPLCSEIGISRTQLYRKLKALTGLTLAKYIRAVRLQVARKLLETTQLNIGEVAFKVGFKDQSYFTRSFSQEFGQTPSALRKN